MKRAGLALADVMRLLVPDMWGARADADDIDEAWVPFERVLSAGAMVAFHADSEMPSSVWSRVVPDTGGALWLDGVQLANVTFQHPAELPDFPKRLARIADLADAFRVYVLLNPVFTAALDRADGMLIVDGAPHAFVVDEMRAGRFSASAAAWPVRLDPYDVASAWLETEPRSFEALKRKLDPARELAIVERAAVSACGVYRRFLEPMRAGRVEVRGLYMPTGHVSEIDPRVFSSATIALTADGRIGDASSGSFNTLWTGAYFKAVTAPKTPTRDRSGRADGIEWDFAIDQVMFYLNNGGKFANRKQLVEQTLDILQDKKQPSANAVMDFYRKYYPALWQLLDRKALT